MSLYVAYYKTSPTAEMESVYVCADSMQQALAACASYGEPVGVQAVAGTVLIAEQWMH